jgi:CRP/FNR family transcriptional regulator
MEAFCASVPFKPGSEQTAEQLCAIGSYRVIGRGVELCSDASEDRLVFIAGGAAKLVARSNTTGCKTGLLCEGAAAETHVLAFHFAGDIVSVLRQPDSDFRLIALNDLELISFFANPFLDIAQNDPAVLRAVLTRALQSLHRSRTKMMQLGHKSAHQRIADFLVTMAERVCDCTCGACQFTLPMSRRDIGDSLGLTIETVSRQFAELREAGLISTQGRSHISINDIGALSMEAGHTAKTRARAQT